MRHLTVYRRFFTQSDCYKADVTSGLVGVQVHSTGANNPYLRRYVQPDDGRLGVNKNGNSHNRPGVDVCANAYIGKMADGTVAVYQTLPWDTRCWISGKGDKGNANKLGYIGFEICEDDLTDIIYFEQAVMGAAVNLTAYLCLMMGLRPYWTVSGENGALSVMDHSELAAHGLASGHADITHWLRRFGKSMSDFRSAVVEAMDEGVDVEYIDASEIEKEEWENVNATFEVYAENFGYVNLRSEPDIESESLEKLRNGDKVTVTARSSVWCKCETLNHVGYVMTDFLREVKQEENIIIPIGNPTIIDSVGNRFVPVGNWRVEWTV